MCPVSSPLGWGGTGQESKTRKRKGGYKHRKVGRHKLTNEAGNNLVGKGEARLFSLTPFLNLPQYGFPSLFAEFSHRLPSENLSAGDVEDRNWNLLYAQVHARLLNYDKACRVQHPLQPHAQQVSCLPGAGTGSVGPRSVAGSLPGKSVSLHPGSAVAFAAWQDGLAMARTQGAGAGKAGENQPDAAPWLPSSLLASAQSPSLLPQGLVGGAFPA